MTDKPHHDPGHIQWIPHGALPPSPRCRLGLLAVGAIIGFGLPFFIAGTALLVTDTSLRVEVVRADRLPKRMSLAKVYSAAADALRKYGHCKNELQNHSGQMCIWGAISFVIDGDAHAVSAASDNALLPLNKMLGADVIDWNNDADTTPRQIIAFLRKASRARSLASRGE